MRTRLIRGLVLAVWLWIGGGLALANPMKTDKGNPVANWQFFPNGITIFGNQILPPGMAQEDGSGPPGKVIRYIPRTEIDAATQAAIIAADRAAHPSIPAVGSSPPTWSYDCHGLTFKSGKMWIDDSEVEQILTDQGWNLAPANGAKVGDIVVYRKNGKITHTGTVTAVDGNGNVTEVFSKWGARGDYKHAPNDVPASYGTPEVRTGGKALADPPLAPEDVNVFNGIQPPPAKLALIDFNTNPDAPTDRNTPPVPYLESVSHGPNTWNYGLTIPPQGLTITPGDELRLYSEQWINAQVSGLAALSAYGGWQLQSVNTGVITFMATQPAFLPDGTPMFDGFIGLNLPSIAGTLVYTESVAGSVALVDGPVAVPEPAVLATIMLVALFGFRRNRAARN